MDKSILGSLEGVARMHLARTLPVFTDVEESKGRWQNVKIRGSVVRRHSKAAPGL